MAELNKKELKINLSYDRYKYDQNNNLGSKILSPSKSPRNFMESNGAVGLGIVVALKESDPISGRGPVLCASPRSNPIPISSPNFVNSVSNAFSVESEEYTYVISHVRNNMIEKREYFGDDLVNGSEKTDMVMVSNSSAAGAQPGKDLSEFEPADFLSSCFLCEKNLHGLDIFIYRGDKAFCSAECRYKQIVSDERREKRNLKVNKKQTKFSVSPCSDQLQFFAGVAAA